MKQLFLLLIAIMPLGLLGQSGSISGKLVGPDNTPVEYANITLHDSSDSSLVKVETSDNLGQFVFAYISKGSYFLGSTYVGYEDIWREGIIVEADNEIDLGELRFVLSTTLLDEATVTAQRAIVEVKPDRTVFNVQGTINSVGSDGISLLRKAPGVVVDNNNNITVLGRNGVLVYVDGKRLPLAGEDLSNYIQNLTAEQIDRIDIISNPGAKYEAEGNAGVIDIRLRKNKNHGSNGSISSSVTQGRYTTGNSTFLGNYKNKNINVYGSLGANAGKRYTEIDFNSFQNGINLKEFASFINEHKGGNGRLGVDYSIGKNHTIGLLVSGNFMNRDGNDLDRIKIANENTPEQTDSVLIAKTVTQADFIQNSYNINYRYDNKEWGSVNIDVDYGLFNTDRNRFQPNEFYTGDQGTLISRTETAFDTPTDIGIFTAKVDVEKSALGGIVEVGSKLSLIDSDNSFLVYDVIESVNTRDDYRSNIFGYKENVYAGYFNLKRDLTEQISMSSGIRAERTVATGDLQAFLPELQEDPVEQEYTSWFPSLGFTYSSNPNHVFGLNYGRRINRPDYSVLNPFVYQLSEISFSKGNPGLLPEIVNNYEFSYTLNYRYNLKLSYSKTEDQITRLIGPDDADPRATFINWDNLSEQNIYNASFSAPITVTDKWNAYFNLSLSYKDNQADYGDGATVDLQALSYNIFQQQTINLPKGYTFEVSGWYAGPGIWGGVFSHDAMYSLNLGIQKKFFDNNLNVKLSANDITYQTGWSGYSEFDGLYSEGFGNWDSRTVSLNLSYSFGNENVRSRNRRTGLEEEAGRVNDSE